MFSHSSISVSQYVPVNPDGQAHVKALMPSMQLKTKKRLQHKINILKIKSNLSRLHSKDKRENMKHKFCSSNILFISFISFIASNTVKFAEAEYKGLGGNSVLDRFQRQQVIITVLYYLFSLLS